MVGVNHGNGNPDRVTVRAPAKINLQLAVGPPRADGFHDLVTVYQAVGLYDEVTAQRLPVGSGIRVTLEGLAPAGRVDAVPLDETNLVWRAADAVAAAGDVEPDVALHVRKRIPVAAGLAGGSADAAAALVACDHLWRAGLARDDLAAIGADLGSDVPFALHGGTAVGTGRGEQLSSALTRGGYHWVLALADGALSTPEVYGELDRLRSTEITPIPDLDEALMAALRAGDAEALGRALGNDLQRAAVSLRPALARTLDVGEDCRALGCAISGSGPSCVFLARDEDHAMDLVIALTGSGTCRTALPAAGPVTGAKIIESGAIA